METIYLVGQISPKYRETYQWRENLESYFRDSSDFQFINPCNNLFNRKILKDGEYVITKERRISGIDILPSKDYTFCKRSSMAIVNMNHYDSNKPLLGSYFELAWYYTMPEKTVIGFANDLDDYECQHPFVQQAVTTWCNDEFEAAALIDQYFSFAYGM